MARLSEEHYRATKSMSTPKSARTSGRLRDMFKPRRSDNSISPKALIESPPADVESVGVCTSDRESLQVSTEELSGAADGNVKPSRGPEGSVSGDAETAFAGSSGVQPPDKTVVDNSVADNEAGANEGLKSVGTLSSSTPIQDTVLAEQNGGSHLKSFASNIFDDQDSLSAGVREYVESKIAEAFHKHACDCPVRSPLNITAKFELDNAGDMSRSLSFKRVPVDTSILHGPKQIGPLVLEYSSNTYSLQMSVIGMYMFIIMLSALLGPRPLFILTWRVSTMLLIYSITGRLLGWKTDAHSDVLLAPVLHIARLAHNLLCDAVDQYGIFKVYINSQIMRESLAEVGVVFDPKQQ